MHFTDLAEQPTWYGRWNDKAGNVLPQSFGYVVEFSVVPEPSSAAAVLVAATPFLLRRRSR